MNRLEKPVIYAGESLPLEFIVNKDGNSFPLSAITIQFKMTNYGGTTSILTKDTSKFIIQNNKALLTLLSADTQNLSYGTYEYIVTFTDSAGNVDKQKGEIEIIADII